MLGGLLGAVQASAPLRTAPQPRPSAHRSRPHSPRSCPPRRPRRKPCAGRLAMSLPMDPPKAARASQTVQGQFLAVPPRPPVSVGMPRSYRLGTRAEMDEVEDVPTTLQRSPPQVLHDGKVAYPEAVEAVRALHEAGAKLIILSNSSRRSDTTLAKLEPMGFDPTWFAGVITSRPTTFLKHMGTRCLHLTWGVRGAISLEGLGLEVTEDVEWADFILAHGTEALGTAGGPRPISEEEVKALLKVCAKRRMPMLVANPDLVTVSGSSLVTMPGMYAKWYAEMGGEVHLFGKPAKVVYTTALEMTGATEKAAMVAVGDSLEHDIEGAANAGIHSVFITSGIHNDDLPNRCLEQGTALAIQTFGKEVAHLAEELDVSTPTYFMRRFKW